MMTQYVREMTTGFHYSMEAVGLPLSNEADGRRFVVYQSSLLETDEVVRAKASALKHIRVQKQVFFDIGNGVPAVD